MYKLLLLILKISLELYYLSSINRVLTIMFRNKVNSLKISQTLLEIQTKVIKTPTKESHPLAKIKVLIPNLLSLYKFSFHLFSPIAYKAHLQGGFDEVNRFKAPSIF